MLTAGVVIRCDLLDARIDLFASDDKPGKMPIERCTELQRLLAQANSFIGAQEQEKSALGDFGGPQELAGLSLDELRDEVMRLRAQVADGPDAGSRGAQGGGAATR